MILNLIYIGMKLWCSTILFFCRPVLNLIETIIKQILSEPLDYKKGSVSYNSLLNSGNGYPSSSTRHGKKRRRQQFRSSTASHSSQSSHSHSSTSSSSSTTSSSSSSSTSSARLLIEEQRRKLKLISEGNINTPMRIQRRRNSVNSPVKPSKRSSSSISIMNKQKYHVVKKATIHRLPIELMLCVLEQLPTKRDLYNCLFVCKSWNHIVTPFLYKSPQICHLSQNFPIQKYGPLIRMLDLSTGHDHVTDGTIQLIAMSCPNLRRINLSRCSHISDASLEALAKNSCSSSLISINLCGCRKITDLGLKYLSKSCHSLTSLSMADCGKISDKGVIFIARSCPRLRQIRLSDCPRVTEQSIEVLVQNCTRLSWLDIARIGKITDSSVRVIANSCGEHLEWLNLARPSPLDAVYSSALVSPTLLPITYLDFNDVVGVDKDDITDASITLLTKLCPNLQLLDLSYMNSITNYSIQSIANNSYSLVCLTIIGCRFVTCDSLRYLAQLRRKSGHLGCITMGDADGITEEDIESITNEPEGLLSGWQKSSVDENSLKEILGGSWEDVGSR